MKLLIGLDKQKRFESAVRLLQRLGFENTEWHLAHFVSVIDPESSSNVHIGSDAAEILHAYFGSSPETESLVSELTATLSAKVHLLPGSPAKSLMEFAETIKSDIVGLGSVAHGSVGAALVGSIGRAFAIGSKQSFLVGRGRVGKSGKLRVVFATDHSEYSINALKAFVAMKPSGIEKLVLMTAHELMEPSEIVQHVDLVEGAKEAGRSLEQHFRFLNEQLVKTCTEAGIPTVAELRNGFASPAIDEAVAEHKADLVVMGSQGHGFIERILIGSTALHQVVASKHSTLVIRSAK